jgi:hypothetical protein
MRASKSIIAGLIFAIIFSSQCLPATRGDVGNAFVRGIFEIQTPGSKTWTFTFSASHEYWVAVNLASAGPIPMSLVVQDPWGAAYTLFDLSFTQGKDTDAYAVTFIAPEDGSYSFTLSTGAGQADAAEVMFGVADLGALHSTHATNTSTVVLADARACNASYTSWTYAIYLEANSTYYLDAARGAPCSTKNVLNVTASLAGSDGSQVLVLGNTALPWGTPVIATGQLLQWATGWFGVQSNGTYTLTINAIGQPAAVSAIVATAVSKIDHGTAPASNSTSNTTTTASISIGTEGLALMAGLSVSGLGIGMVATAATRRKKKGGAESGEVRRTSPFSSD